MDHDLPFANFSAGVAAFIRAELFLWIHTYSFVIGRAFTKLKHESIFYSKPRLFKVLPECLLRQENMKYKVESMKTRF